MNKIFKVIWNHATQTWVAVSELTSARGKSSRKTDKRLAPTAIAIAVAGAGTLIGGQALAATAIAEKMVLAPSTTNSEGEILFYTANMSTGIVLGENANTVHKDSIAIGTDANATGCSTVALGSNITTALDNSVILGNASDGAATFVPTQNVTINGVLYNSTTKVLDEATFAGVSAAENGVVSIGSTGKERQLKHVAAGQITADSTDGINGSQLYAAMVKLPKYFSVNSTGGIKNAEGDMSGGDLTSRGNQDNEGAYGEDSIAIGKDAWVKDHASSSIAIGNNSHARDPEQVIIGHGARSNSGTEFSVGIGSNANLTVNAKHAVLVGANSVTNGERSVVIGTNITADKTRNDVTVVGHNSTVTGSQFGVILGENNVLGAKDGTKDGEKSIIVGTNSTIIREYSSAIGFKNNVSAKRTHVMGNNVTATDENSVVLGNNASGTETVTAVQNAAVNGVTYGNFAGVGDQKFGYVSVGKKGEERQIKNVAAGSINATSTDAINGSQLYQTITNAGWKVFQNSNAAANLKDTVNFGDEVVFADGKNTKVSVVTTDNKTTTVKFDVELPAVEPTKIEGKGLAKVTGEGTTAKPYVVEVEGTALSNNANGTVAQNTYETYTDQFGAPFTGETAIGADGKLYKAEELDEYDEPALGILPLTVTKVDNGDKLVNATTVTNAINNSGFTVTSDKTGTGTNSGTSNELINPGETVKYIAGDNIDIKQDGNNFTIATSHNPTFENNVTVGGKVTEAKDAEGNPLTKVGDSYYKTEDLENGKPKPGVNPVAPENVVETKAPAVTFTAEEAKPATNNADETKPTTALNVTSADGKPSQIVGVGSSLNKTPVATTPNGSDPANPATPVNIDLVDLVGDTTNPINPNAAATVGDLQNMGWVVSAEGNSYKDTVKNANEVEFVGTGLATVTGRTEGNKRIVTVNVDTQKTVEDAQLPVVYTNKAGDKLVKVGDQFFTPDNSDVVKVGDNYYKPSDLENGEPKQDATPVQPVPKGDVIASMNNGENSTTAPMALSNVGGNLAPTYNQGDKKEVNGKPTGDVTEADKYTKSQAAPTNVGNIYNNAATVGDVLNAGFNLQNNGAERDFVKPYDTVNFINGTGTTAVVTTSDDGKVSNVTFNVNVDNNTIKTENIINDAGNVIGSRILANTTTLSAEKNGTELTGKIATPSDEAGKNLVNASTVAKAINEAGFIVTSNQTGSGTNSGASKELINPGETITYIAGDNVDIKQEGNNFTFSVKVPQTGGSSPAEPTKEESVSGSDTITVEDNGKNGTGGKDFKVTAKTTPLTNTEDGKVNTPEAPKALATAGDIADAINKSGFTVTSGKTGTGTNSGTSDELINPGETVKYIAGDNIDIKQDGNNFTIATSHNPTFENNVTVGGKVVTPAKDAEGNDLVKVGDDYYKAGDVVNGVPKQDAEKATPVKPEEKAPAVTFTAEKAKPATNNSPDAQPTTALNVTSADGKPSQIVGVGSSLNKTPVATTPEGSDPANPATPVDSDLVDLKGNEENPVNPNAAATVGDLQNMGWVVSAKGNSYKDTVKNANEVEFVGTGLATVTGITKDNKRIITVNVDTQKTVEDAQLPVVYTNKAGDKLVKGKDGNFYKPADLDQDGSPVANAKPVAKGDVIASMNNGDNSTKAPMTLGNVAGNLAGTPNNGDAPTNKSADQTFTDAQKNNAATLGDVLNSGWNLQNNGEAKDFVRHTDTVNFVNGTGTTAVVETAADGKSSTVTFNVNTDGKTITTAEVPVKDADGNPVLDKNNKPVTESVIKAVTGEVVMNPAAGSEGKVMPKVGDEEKLVNTTKVAEAINNAYHTISVKSTKDTVESEAGSDEVKAGDKINYVAGNGLEVRLDRNATANVSTITLALSHQFTVGEKAQPGKPGVDGYIGVDGQKGTGIGLNGEDGSIGIKGKDGANANITVANGDKGLDGNDGEDGKGKTRIEYIKPNGDKEQVATLNDGLYFQGDNTDVTVDRKLNQQLNIIGGATGAVAKNNIKVTGDKAKATLNVELAKDINLGPDGSLTTGDTVINDKGLTIKNGPSVTKEGINAGGKKITNVERGTAPTDAVNVSQLEQAKGDIYNTLNKNNKELRAGIAGANAAASLPQVYIPGKSMVAASAGTFKGENAFAVGYSRASDNGKLILKLQGNANSRGDIGAGVGVGYQW